jgi:hypothetical protein
LGLVAVLNLHSFFRLLIAFLSFQNEAFDFKARRASSTFYEKPLISSSSERKVRISSRSTTLRWLYRKARLRLKT